MLNTLPHESAATSNTGSKRKDGVLYGFLAAAAASGTLSLVVLSVFKSPSPLLMYLTLHYPGMLNRSAPDTFNSHTQNQSFHLPSFLGRPWKSGQGFIQPLVEP